MDVIPLSVQRVSALLYLQEVVLFSKNIQEQQVHFGRGTKAIVKSRNSAQIDKVASLQRQPAI